MNQSGKSRRERQVNRTKAGNEPKEGGWYTFCSLPEAERTLASKRKTKMKKEKNPNRFLVCTWPYPTNRRLGNWTDGVETGDWKRTKASVSFERSYVAVTLGTPWPALISRKFTCLSSFVTHSDPLERTTRAIVKEHPIRHWFFACTVLAPQQLFYLLFVETQLYQFKNDFSR